MDRKIHFACTFTVFFLLSASISKAQNGDLVHAPELKMNIIDESYDFNARMMVFSQFSLEQFTGLDQSYNGNLGIYRADDVWPPAWMAQSPIPDSLYLLKYNFFRNEDGSYYFWHWDNSDRRYIWLDNEFNFIDTLYIKADSHGLLFTDDSTVLFARNDVMNYFYKGDTLPVIGHDICEYDLNEKEVEVIWKRDKVFNSEYHFPPYNEEGTPQPNTRDGDHFNWICLSDDGNLLINDRHTGYGKIRLFNGDVTWWCGMPEGYPNNTLTPINGTTYEQVRSHLGHSFHQIDKGPYSGYYTWYDNGDHEQRYSRVPIIDIDENAQTIELIEEYKFAWSQCMGSVTFLEDSTFVVSLGCNLDEKFSTILKTERGAKQANRVDSLRHRGPGIYWMRTNGDTIATYSMPLYHGAYKVQIVEAEEVNLPKLRINCNQNQDGVIQLDVQSSGRDISWSTGLEGPLLQVRQPGKYYARIPWGIGYVYTPYFNLREDLKCE